MPRVRSTQRPASTGGEHRGRAAASKGSTGAPASPAKGTTWSTPARTPEARLDRAWAHEKPRLDPKALRARLESPLAPHPSPAGWGDGDGRSRPLHWHASSGDARSERGTSLPRSSPAALALERVDEAPPPAALEPAPARRTVSGPPLEGFSARGPDGLPEAPSAPGTWRDDPKLAHVPVAAAHLALGWDAMHPEQRARVALLDPNTGVLNERAFLALPRDPLRPLVARLSIEGAKALNDARGHEALDGAYRALARVLAVDHPTLGKMGGDLVFKVASQAELDAALMKLRSSPDWDRRFTVTGAVGATVEAADLEHREVKDELRRRGALGDRGDLPIAFSGLDPRAKAAALDEAAARFRAVRAVEDFAIPAPLRAAFLRADDVREATATYVRERTGLLTEAGWRAIPRREWVASIDLRGLKVLNDVFGPEQADRIMDAFGLAIARAGGGRFDFAHLHGDEYACQADSRPELEAFLAALRRLTDALELYVVRPNDSLAILHGVEFAARTGRTYDAADQALNEAKSSGAFAPTRQPELVTGRREVAARLARLEPAGNLRQRGAEQRRGHGGQDVGAALDLLRGRAGEGRAPPAHGRGIEGASGADLTPRPRGARGARPAHRSAKPR